MAFDTLRTSKPRGKSTCRYCGSSTVDGSIQLNIRDKDTKTVTSRSVSGCEPCIIKTYEAAIGIVVPPDLPDTPAEPTTTKAGK